MPKRKSHDQRQSFDSCLFFENISHVQQHAVSHYCSFFEIQLLPRNAPNAILERFSTMKITSAENRKLVQYLNMIMIIDQDQFQKWALVYAIKILPLIQGDCYALCCLLEQLSCPCYLKSFSSERPFK